MLARILPETTVWPGSSTFAAILWRMEMVRLVVLNSRTPRSARMFTPERRGSVELVAMPFETTDSAFASADWLTVNFMVPSPLYISI